MDGLQILFSIFEGVIQLRAPGNIPCMRTTERKVGLSQLRHEISASLTIEAIIEHNCP